jgi:hypothetical protein
MVKSAVPRDPPRRSRLQHDQRHQGFVNTQTRGRGLLALFALGLLFFASRIAATFAAPMERGRPAPWWARAWTGEVGGAGVRKTFDPGASADSNVNPIAASSIEVGRTPVDSNYVDILQLLPSSRDSAICAGEPAQTTRPDSTPSNSSSAIGLQCRFDRASHPK